MGTVDDYLAGLDDDDRAVIGHIYDVVRQQVPGTEQGKGYGMPALLYRGKPLISVMRTKKHIGLYPFSGRVPDQLGALLDGVDHDKGTVRFQPENPLPDDVVRELVKVRVAEIGAA